MTMVLAEAEHPGEALCYGGHRATDQVRLAMTNVRCRCGISAAAE